MGERVLYGGENQGGPSNTYVSEDGAVTYTLNGNYLQRLEGAAGNPVVQYANAYTPDYLRDRAELLKDKLLRGVEDFPVDDFGPHPVESGRYGTIPVRLVDVDSGYDVTRFGGAGVPVVVAFGSDGATADSLQGGAKDDHLYGGGDTLEGGDVVDVLVDGSKFWRPAA